MAEVYIKDVVNEALNQVGKSCGKTNPYSAELDKVKFYNYPKNGVADSCSIFVDDMVYRHTDPKTASNARAILYEPNVDNCGAGVVFAAQYFKAHKAWIDGKDASKAKVGDKVIFAADKYKKKANPYGYYHTGLVVDIDTKNKKIITVEGNTNGGKVAKKTYSFSNSVITKGGFGRPKYTGYEKPKAETPNNDTVTDPKPIETPVPDLKPEPAEPVKPTKSIDEYAKEVIAGKWGNNPQRAIKMKAAGIDYDAVQKRVNEILGVGQSSSSGKKYTVNVSKNSYLNVRVGPGTNYPSISKLYTGDTVTVYEKKGSWGRIGTGKWVSMDYLK